jgi:SAM-dependent methyltransferase
MAAPPDPTHHDLMHRIHGMDIYAGFVPTFAEDRQGWHSGHKAFDDIVAEVRPSVVVDVGVWKGGSTIYLAELLKKHTVTGAVIAVDTFLGSVEHWNRDSHFFDLIPRRHGMPLLYEQFLANVVRTGMKNYIVPLPQTSTVACLLLRKARVQAGLVHIDASHEYEDVLRDARIYWDLLAPGGYLVGDDYHRSWPAVIKAADDFAAEKGVPLSNQSPKWIVKKPR